MKVNFSNVEFDRWEMVDTIITLPATITIGLAALFFTGFVSANAQQQANLSSNILQSAPPAANWWERGNSNPVIHIIVNKTSQQVSVYADGMAISQSNVSTGKKGYDTPGGVFSILSKNRVHFSNLYNRAPMPFMQRLTWSGIALHGSGSVPDYPASHGCVRLPKNFASQLFKFTQKGAQVIVTGLNIRPQRFYSTKMFAIGEAAGQFGDKNYQPTSATVVDPADEKPLRILITRHSGRQKFSEVQKILNELHYSAGDVDGWMGPQTARAITAFQKDYGHRVNGANSEDLLAQLYRASGKGKPKNAHIYVRRNYKSLFDMPVVFSDEEVPLGTHHYAAIYPGKGIIEGQSVAKPHWLSVSIEQTGWPGMSEAARDALQTVNTADARYKVIKASVLPNGAPITTGITARTSASEIEEMPPAASNALRALQRIALPEKLKKRISRLLTPGSTLVIADHGTSLETGLGTDFIVLTR